MTDKQLSNRELKTLLAQEESQYVERCGSGSSQVKEKIAKAVCAFSNDIANVQRTCVIFIGWTDKGKCAGLSVTDKMLLNFDSIRSDGNVQPFPVMNVRKEVIDGCELIVIEVQASKNPPVRYKGCCWVRTGPSTRRASSEEEHRLAEKRKAGDLPEDMQKVMDATIESDLNIEYFKSHYLPGAFSKEVLKENNRNIKAQMRSLSLLDHNFTPTMTAILIMGNNPRNWVPGAYIQFIRFNGVELTDPVRDQKEISGTLPDQIKEIESVLKAHISTSLKLSDHRHIESPDYPITALSQLVRNAVIHRNYKSHTPTRVHWFSDRIEIHSPGGPYGESNQDNFGKGITAYRNPTIALAFKDLGFVERFGFGIPQARKSLKENGNPELELKAEDPAILAVVRKAQ